MTNIFFATKYYGQIIVLYAESDTELNQKQNT